MMPFNRFFGADKIENQEILSYPENVSAHRKARPSQGTGKGTSSGFGLWG